MNINKNPSPFEVRRFAAVWSGVVALMGVTLFLRHKPGARWFWAAGAAVALCAAFVPALAKGFYRGWMAMSRGIHLLVTRIFVLLIFWVVLTPLALFFKLLGRDALGLKKSTAPEESYWKKLETLADPASYKHLY